MTRTTPADPPEIDRLLTRAAARDDSAWRELLALYARRVYAAAKAHIASPELAEEITQSVFVTVAEQLTTGKYVEQGRFEPWLFRIAMNRVRDEARRTKRHATPTDPATFEPIPATSADHPAPDQIELAHLQTALAQLPEADRTVIELRHHAALPFATIALILSEPVGTLLARHHRALRKLKSIIESANQGTTP
jgi:RNA polymerase sigma-70 factor (ECF subfamily)